MLRTRDFLLFIVTIVFLLVGIGTTIAVDAGLKDGRSSAFNLKSPQDGISVSATGTEEKVIDREARLVAMREKLESMSFSEISNSPSAEEEVADLVEDSLIAEDDEESTSEIPLRCLNYNEEPVAWSPIGLEFEEIEGARLVYRQLPSSLAPNASGTDLIEIPNREVVLQLSLRTMPLPNPTCLSSDVVGVAMDGSLIRNTESALYSIFGSDTLIGYALDGFPIYGNTPVANTDDCGGILAGDSYRYVISSDRDYILGCFSGLPASIY
jgi:hypothetical protein